MARNKYTFIDLFAGCGGLSLGFEMAGFKSLLAIDNWKDALTTYAYNRKGAKTLCGDLATLEPCNTISAHLAKVSLNSTDPVYMVKGRYRRFSVREAARIQSFPDSFDFSSVSQSRQYKAIGNAVPPVLMWHLIRSLQKCVGNSTN